MRRVRWMRDYVTTLRAWGRWAVAAAGTVDIWHAHDLPGLMAVGPHARPRSLVYDSHEIFLESGTAARLPGVIKRLLGRYERRLVRRTRAPLVTVNEAYAEVLRRRLRPDRIVIVRNCAPIRWVARDRSPLRAAAGLSANDQVVLYHGSFGAHRGIEQLAAALDQPGMEAVQLVLLGFGDVRSLGIDPDGSTSTPRVHVIDAVPPGELLEWVAGADVDAMPIQRSTLNHWLCTPNKLWESLASGVPVVVSDFPVMRTIVMDDPDGPLGTVCAPDDPASIAVAIRSVVERPEDERTELRERVRRAAHERWNWEAESARLVDLYASFEVST